MIESNRSARKVHPSPIILRCRSNMTLGVKNSIIYLKPNNCLIYGSEGFEECNPQKGVQDASQASRLCIKGGLGHDW